MRGNYNGLGLPENTYKRVLISFSFARKKPAGASWPCFRSSSGWSESSGRCFLRAALCIGSVASASGMGLLALRSADTICSSISHHGDRWGGIQPAVRRRSAAERRLRLVASSRGHALGSLSRRLPLDGSCRPRTGCRCHVMGSQARRRSAVVITIMSIATFVLAVASRVDNVSRPVAISLPRAASGGAIDQRGHRRDDGCRFPSRNQKNGTARWLVRRWPIRSSAAARRSSSCTAIRHLPKKRPAAYFSPPACRCILRC